MNRGGNHLKMNQKKFINKLTKRDMGLTKIEDQFISVTKKVQIYRQTYDKPENIQGVHIGKANTFSDDYGGWFKETMRLDEEGNNLALKEAGIKFRPVQSNTSFLAPKTKRFWHIHPKQNEIWTTNGTLLLGLIDYRSDSPTYQTKMKVILSADKFIYIPAGVAHGFINPNESFVTLNYFTDQFFVADENTQECRIDPKDVSYDFVKPEIM
jgi:dTDP-4-dehydrorhamnose 3,5-epimerase-like enzyme